MINKSKLHDFASGLITDLSDLHTALPFLIFAVTEAYTTFILLTSQTVMDIPNIFINAGIPTQIREWEILGFRLDQLYVLFSIQFVAAYAVSVRGRKYVNILLLTSNVFARLLCSLHLPIYLGDIFRNELYGELAVRGYNPYTTYSNEGIPFAREYEAAGLPAYMWSQFTFTYPTFTGACFFLLCSVFPGYGYWQEVFLLFITSMLDVFAGLLISRIHRDADYRYAVLYTFFPPILNMDLNGQIEAIPNFLTILSYHYLTREHFYRSALTLALAFQSKFYPLAWLPVNLHRSKKRTRTLLCFALVASIMSIPFITSPDYFKFFKEMVIEQPYFFRMFDLIFVVVSLILTFTKRNIVYATIPLIFGVLCLSSHVPIWFYLWIIPTAFILMKDDEKTSTALLFYMFITNPLHT